MFRKHCNHTEGNIYFLIIQSTHARGTTDDGVPYRFSRLLASDSGHIIDIGHCENALGQPYYASLRFLHYFPAHAHMD